MPSRSRMTPGMFLFPLQLVLVIVAILTLLFFLQRLSGDPASVLAGHNSSPEVIEGIREEMGLNEPITVQYAVFLGNAFQLDFGDSLRFQQPALSLVLDRLPHTLLLSVSALTLAVIIGVPLGIYAALSYRQPQGVALNMFAGVLQALPTFWLGLLLLLIFTVHLDWFGSVSNLEDNLFKRLALPTITLSTFYIARLIRLVRSGLIEELEKTYILTAHSKGLSPQRVLFIHALKNSLIPVVAFVMLDLSFLIGGSVIVESVFSYSGMGDQLVKAIFNRDFALVQATVFVIAVLVFLINASSDLLYRLIDPRITY